MRRSLFTALLLSCALALLVALPATAALPWTIGTPGDDRMRGGPEADRIDGRAGPDELYGLGSRDTLRGGFGRDDLRGGDGRDHLLGSGVAGSGASQHDNGDTATDTLHDGAAEFGFDRSADVLSGGSGDDVLVSVDAAPAEDRLVCGEGSDRAYADAGDVVSGDCEKVERR